MSWRGRPWASAGAALVLLVLLAAVLAPVLSPHPPTLQDLARSQQPPAWLAGGSWENPLGTDHLGRDVLSRILYGSRVSLVVGGGGVALALAIGLLVGLLAGYARGWVDDVAMRLCDVQLSLPYLLFVVAIVGVLGPSLRNVVLVFGIADFPLFARMTRGETLRLRAAPFVESASRRKTVRASVANLGSKGARSAASADARRSGRAAMQIRNPKLEIARRLRVAPAGCLRQAISLRSVRNKFQRLEIMETESGIRFEGEHYFGQSRQSQRRVSGKMEPPCLPLWPPSPRTNW